MRTILLFTATLFVFGALATTLPGRYGIGDSLFAQVGMSVGVQENTTNRIAQELADKERRLAMRERELDARTERASAQATHDINRYVLVLLGLLSALILLNLWLDHRVREQLTRTATDHG